MQGINKVPLLDLSRSHRAIAAETSEAIARVVDSQQFIMGPDVHLFEEESARYLEVPHAVACASGSDALLLALQALGVGPGDEVVTTPFSFFATAACIARLGATPVFADVREDSFNISMEAAAAAFTPRTKAFIPVHLFGQLSRVDEIDATLKQRGIALVEDCAQSFGAHRMAGGHIVRSGGWGSLGCFSFFPTKNLGAFGDAGMVTAHDGAQAEHLKRLRLHGAAAMYQHDEIGVNSRMDTMQAAVLRVRLRRIEEWIEQRREAARIYGMMIAERGLLDRVKPPVEDDGCRHTYHQYVIRAQRRDELLSYLTEHGVSARVYYPIPLHLQPCFEYVGMKRGSLPVAERLCGEVLALPIFPGLTEGEQDYVVRTIDDFYRG